MSGGVKAAKFEKVGDKVQGVILQSEVRDQTDINTGEVKRFPDGNPMKQVVITIMTDPMVQEDDDDDGMRRIYCKGQMVQALREALRKANVRGPADGGKLAVQYVGDGVAKQRGFNPPKQYKVWYEDPPRRVDVGDPFADEPPPF